MESKDMVLTDKEIVDVADTMGKIAVFPIHDHHELNCYLQKAFEAGYKKGASDLNDSNNRAYQIGVETGKKAGIEEVVKYLKVKFGNYTGNPLWTLGWEAKLEEWGIEEKP